MRRDSWAEEVVQETFLAAYKWKHTYDERFSFRTWLWTILLNQCRAHLARHARTPRVVTWSDEACEAEQAGILQASLDRGGEAPGDRLLAEERTELLNQLLAKLPAAQADALRLRFFGDFTFQEIADALSCSLGTAKNRVRWGLTRLSALATKNSTVSPAIRESDVIDEA
jgi:RNA polymerase sigma-70 factor (ECF subfamily)